MARLLRSLVWLSLIAGILFVAFLAARKFNAHFRPDYAPIIVAASPNGRCALVQYKFRGGERWYWTDRYRLLLLLEGDAFYTVQDLETGALLRDSTTEFPAIDAMSEIEHYMYWQGNTVARFPESAGPYHEWLDLTCDKGRSTHAPYNGMLCFGSDKALCRKLFEDVTRFSRR